METVLEDGPPIGRNTFSSDLICQRMLPIPSSPRMVPVKESIVIHALCFDFFYQLVLISLVSTLLSMDAMRLNPQSCPIAGVARVKLFGG